MSEKKSNKDLFWHEGEVTRDQRHDLLGHKGATLWFTGLSGCGKSTLAVSLEVELLKQKKLSYRLDGDNIRLGINSDLGFTSHDRIENIRRIGEIAKLMADSGVIVLCSFISPYRSDRDRVREIHISAGIPFYEIFVDCPLEVAEERDPKGLYRKARIGLIPNFTGISDPYETPENPEIHLFTHQQTLDEETELVIERLRSDQIL